MLARQIEASQLRGLSSTRRVGVGAVVALVALTGVAARTPSSAAAPIEGGVRLVAVADAAGIDFTHVYGGRDKRYITEMGGSGGAWLDYDIDGWIDLLLVNGLSGPADDPVAAAQESSLVGAAEASAPGEAGHHLFHNRGGRFSDVTSAAGVGDPMWGNGAAVADVDNDGLPDLYVTAIGPNRLYRNNGDGTFSSWEAGVDSSRWGTSAAFTDWDGDGYLDLYVADYVNFDAADIPAPGDGVCFYRGIEVLCGPEGLVGEHDVFYRNRGDGTFVVWPGVTVDPEANYGFALIATDCDADRRPNIYVATDSTMNLLYRHGADDGLLDWSLFSGAGYSGAGREQAGMGVTAADYDGDGDFDLYVTNFQHDYNNLYRNLGDCSFEDVSEQLDLALSSRPYMGWAPQFFDVDGDGDQDLFVANGHIYPQLDAAGLEPYAQRNLLYLNDLVETGEAHFREAVDGAGPGMEILASSRAALLGDYDNDGDLDLLVTNINDSPTLLNNSGEMQSPFLRLSLVARSGNRDAYGATLMVESGGRRRWFELRGSDGYVGSNDPRLLVFLPGGIAERLQIIWPGGKVTELRDVRPGWIVLDEARGLIASREP